LNNICNSWTINYWQQYW